MPNVFVYESLTANGQGRNPSDPAHSFFVEGRAMRDALVADFAAIPDFTVLTLDDVPRTHFPELFANHVRAADGVILIAPEIDGELESIARFTESIGGRLLGCSANQIAAASNKLALAFWWRDHGVPTPETISGDAWYSGMWPFPVVVKPIRGAGSFGVTSCDTEGEVAAALARLGPKRSIIQRRVPGLAASIAFLCGRHQRIGLVPTSQRLATDFAYLGGELPLPGNLGNRAKALARQALKSSGRGYIGVDLVLGDDPSGSQDYAIEINPRLTTSYLGQRAAIHANVAALWWNVVHGNPIQPYRLRRGAWHFRADGRIERTAE